MHLAAAVCGQTALPPPTIDTISVPVQRVQLGVPLKNSYA
jgi:hypothetical protein